MAIAFKEREKEAKWFYSNVAVVALNSHYFPTYEYAS